MNTQLATVPVIEPEKLLTIIATARQLAVRAHTGPYFEHVLAVANGVRDLAKPIAYLHDVIRDTSFTDKELRTVFPDWIVDRVLLLTWIKGVSYFEYILNLHLRNDALVTEVKLADLENDMADLAPGGQLDKYRFAYTLLELNHDVDDLQELRNKFCAPKLGPKTAA